MLSSTSSSNQRLPSGPWLRTWGLTLALSIAALGSCELFWRSRGFVPSVTDDANLWSLARAQVHPDDPDQIVIIGGSRAQLDLDPDVFARSFAGRRPIQLAVDASSCIPALHDLSETPSFRGILICDVLPEAFFSGIDVNSPPQSDYVRHYHSQTISAPFEARLSLIVQSHLALRLPDVALTLSNLRTWLKRGRLPTPGFIAISPDRVRRADYLHSDILAVRADRDMRVRLTKPGITEPRLSADIQAIASMVDKIQRRGGRVIFVTLPVSGVTRAVEENCFPRPKYWNLLADRCSAISIHYADYPALAAFTCPEGSHLDYRDAPPFSAALAKIIRAQLDALPHHP